MVVETILQSTTPTSLTAIISTYSCILFLSEPENIDHSYIIFLILYLLNKEQILKAIVSVAEKQSLNRIHVTVSLTNALLFNCLRVLCCTRHRNCQGHNKNLSKVQYCLDVSKFVFEDSDTEKHMGSKHLTYYQPPVLFQVNRPNYLSTSEPRVLIPLKVNRSFMMRFNSLRFNS